MGYNNQIPNIDINQKNTVLETTASPICSPRGIFLFGTSAAKCPEHTALNSSSVRLQHLRNETAFMANLRQPRNWSWTWYEVFSQPKLTPFHLRLQTAYMLLSLGSLHKSHKLLGTQVHPMSRNCRWLPCSVPPPNSRVFSDQWTMDICWHFWHEEKL